MRQETGSALTTFGTKKTGRLAMQGAMLLALMLLTESTGTARFSASAPVQPNAPDGLVGKWLGPMPGDAGKCGKSYSEILFRQNNRYSVTSNSEDCGGFTTYGVYELRDNAIYFHQRGATPGHAIGLYNQAEEHLRVALTTYRALYGEQHPKIAENLYYLGAVMDTKADYAAAESMWRQAIEMMRAVDKENVNLPYMLQDLGGLLATQGNAEGEPMLNEALELFRQRYGEDHITVVETYNRFGVMYEGRSDLDRAQAMFEEALACARRLPDVQATIVVTDALGALGRIHREKGEYAEAEALYTEALDLRRKSSGDSHPGFANILLEFSSLHYLMRDYAEAEAEAKSALEIYRRSFPEGNPFITATLSKLGVIAAKAGQPARARGYLREALNSYRTAQQKGIPNSDASSLAELLTLLGRYAEAEALLIKSYNDLKAQYGEQYPSTVETRQRLVTLYEDWNKPDMAARFR